MSDNKRMTDAELRALGALGEEVKRARAAELALTARVAELEAAAAGTCVWYRTGTYGWAGECGAHWGFIAGAPPANGMHRCPNCGKKVQPRRSPMTPEQVRGLENEIRGGESRAEYGRMDAALEAPVVRRAGEPPVVEFEVES